MKILSTETSTLWNKSKIHNALDTSLWVSNIHVFVWVWDLPELSSPSRHFCSLYSCCSILFCWPLTWLIIWRISACFSTTSGSPIRIPSWLSWIQNCKSSLLYVPFMFLYQVEYGWYMYYFFLIVIWPG